MEMVKVFRAPIVACLTCPLCSSLLEEATTISECLHSFCRDCIHLKLSEEDTQACPICDVYLGVAPLEKLRPDPQLDEVRNKIFNMTTKRRVSTGGSPSPRKRKERTLSSLGLLSAPSSSARRKTTTTSRSQYYTRTTTKDLSSSDYESEPEEDRSDSSASERHVKPTREDKGKGVAAGYQSPLAYLAELADSDHPGRSSGKPSSSKDEGLKKYSRLSRPAKGVVRKRTTSAAANAKANADSDAKKVAAASMNSAMWFALKPGDNQTLPPIPTPYLRITDGRLPVSLVKKYLATKLELLDETEVELTCRGQPVVSSLPLENVQKIWLNPQEISADSSGTTAVQQFLLTLTYAKKPSQAAAAAAEQIHHHHQDQQHHEKQKEDSFIKF